MTPENCRQINSFVAVKIKLIFHWDYFGTTFVTSGQAMKLNLTSLFTARTYDAVSSTTYRW